jgi:hypothetical protein
MAKADRSLATSTLVCFVAHAAVSVRLQVLAQTTSRADMAPFEA